MRKQFAPSVPMIITSSSGIKEEFSNEKKPSRDILCYKCQGHGHYAFECSNKCVKFVSDQGDCKKKEGLDKLRSGSQQAQKSKNIE